MSDLMPNVSDDEIFREADMLLQRHGHDAVDVAETRANKLLVEDNLEIDSGGHLPERSFDHWRTQRKNMDTLLQALGKQVTTVGDRDSSFPQASRLQ